MILEFVGLTLGVAALAVIVQRSTNRIVREQAAPRMTIDCKGDHVCFASLSGQGRLAGTEFQGRSDGETVQFMSERGTFETRFRGPR